ncbi:carboxypeptidase Q-like isoform X3 [Folsomia candida]|uniref:carboxypeptidase Q-like isoform X3 n=1 Tax=Folsomia candida TaxID=158441 RepID=UPI001604E7E1|nr:carboxypeptidase Q-like isoform X3 [Folsomia candida]
MVLNLTMMDEELSRVTSRNAIGEITGSLNPEEIVVVSGHIDAWDQGQGAMDDAGGVFVSVEALALIKYLGLTPKRTMQAILWTAEEFGLVGARAFVALHKEEMMNYKAVLESDSGNFFSLGLEFAGTEGAGCIIQEILKLTSAMNSTNYARYETVGSDIAVMILEGVPGISLKTADEKYFYFHHSPADMLNVLDSDELDRNIALWAITSYVLADLSVVICKLQMSSVLP